jgi:hypothetical protein
MGGFEEFGIHWHKLDEAELVEHRLKPGIDAYVGNRPNGHPEEVFFYISGIPIDWGGESNDEGRAEVNLAVEGTSQAATRDD